MGRLKSKRFKKSGDQQKSRSGYVCGVELVDTEVLARRERYFEFFVVAVFLAFGAYQSVLYFGHKIVPTSDFPSFVKIGHELLSFKVPSSFKQAPVYCLLLACLSHVVGGQHPDLMAGWLINAILHPLNLILFYRVGKEIVGKSAIWFAIIAILNPWVLRMLTDPIVETTLLFFILLTLYFIFKRSKWRYLLASITTVVRYEGAALIMAAFVMDMIYSTARRERLRAFLYSAMASVPLGIWLLGTALTWYSPASSTHYLKIFGAQSYYSKLLGAPYESRVGFMLNMRVLWQTGFQPLFMLPTLAKSFFTKLTSAEIQFIQTFLGASKVIALAGFAFGCIYGLCKRQWKILTLLIFFVPYFWVHARLPAPLMRYHTPIFWIALFICWFGLQGLWQIINKNQRIPVAVITTLQVLIMVVAGIWVFGLLPYLPKISAISHRSASVPYVAVGLAGFLLGVQIFVFKPRHLLKKAVVLTVFALVIVSNQFMLVNFLGDGQTDKEFVDLADWYIANAKPGEKLGVYMAEVVKMFAPKYVEYIVYPPQADSPEDFVKACYKEGITYVVWATREGLSRDHPDYSALGLDKNMALLAEPRSIGPYEFVGQVGSERGYTNIFRLRSPP